MKLSTFTFVFGAVLISSAAQAFAAGEPGAAYDVIGVGVLVILIGLGSLRSENRVRRAQVPPGRSRGRVR